MCREEAKQLSSLHDVMATHGVGLHAVVHETLGAEEFKAFFKGDVYYDPEKVFYGPVERWNSIHGMLNFVSLSHMIKSFSKDTKGNMAGEGRLLGAVFVIGPVNDGIIYQHHEKVVGDTADIPSIREAIQKINKMQ